MDHHRSAPQHLGLPLVPDISLIALATLVDPLRLTNDVLGRPAYAWTTLGIGRVPVASSDGIRVTPEASLLDGP